MIESGFSLMYYHENTVSKSLIHHLKYKNTPELGMDFANLMFNKIIEFHEKQKITGIIYVPLHEKKYKIRGYNQLEILAKTLSKKIKIPIFKDALKVDVYQESQTTKNKINRFERRKNIFKKNENINSGTYLLIDDVSTSGATIINCIEELKKNPEIKILVATIAYVY